MSDFHIPKIDPEIIEQSRRMTEAKRKAERRQYLADHRFDIFNSITAFVALIVAVLGLFFPKG